MSLRVLIAIAHYQPGWKFGGPTRTIANLVDGLGEAFSFHILTSDRDFGDDVPFSEITPDAWLPVGKATVRYMAPRNRSLTKIAQLLRETPYELLYLNSFFNPRFTIALLVARRLGLAPPRPVVLAPRGEFSSGAIALKARKKQAWIAFSKAVGLYANIVWQASTEAEADDIRRVMGSVARIIYVAPHLPRPATAVSASPLIRDAGDPLRVVFLSRISPMKNLHFALRTLAQVRTPIRFTVYGPKEDAAYWRSCEAIIETLPDHIQVTYGGFVPSERVIEALSKHNLFFLPTLGENYGHVIIEALQAGLPVLISDQTPWRNLEVMGIGRDAPLDAPAAFADFIETVATMSDKEHAAMRARVRAHAYTLSESDQALEANRNMFLAALEVQA